MPALSLLSLSILALGLLPDRYPAAGFLWDWLAGLGFCALAMIAFLGWESESPATNPRLRLHRNIAVLATLLTALHSIGYLLYDSTLLEYLKPTAPPYMLIGVVAFAALLGATVSAFPGSRRTIYGNFKNFRSWHRWLVALVVIGSLWHVLGTSFSIVSPLQISLLVLLTLLLPSAALYSRRRQRKIPLTRAPASDATADSNGYVLLLISMSFAAAYAAFKNLF